MDERYDAAVVAAAEGAEWAWRELYLWLSPRLLCFLRARGAVEPTDALGEVWLQLARNMSSFSGSAAGFRTWAFTVAHHRVIDEARRRRRRVSVVPLDAGAGVTDPSALPGRGAEVALDTMELEELAGLTETLTSTQRSVILLRVFGDLSVRQTADALGITEAAVKSAQHRAVKSLREILGDGATKTSRSAVDTVS